MIAAFIVACNPLIACMMIGDTRGPYETLERCQARVEEMMESLPPLLPASPVPWELTGTCRSEDGSRAKPETKV